MRTKLKSLFGFLCFAGVLAGNMVHAQESIETRIGKLQFTHDFANGYPTDATRDKLIDEIDVQRACQAYLWSIPIVSMAQWQFAHEEQLGAENGQIVLCESYDDKIGGLTYNATTPYALPFIDLSDEPWIAVMPEGEVRGAAHDMWQIGITQITEPGKYLFVGPGQDAPEGAQSAGYRVFQSPTNSLLLGIRLMPVDREARIKLLEQIAIYPWSERDKPQPRGYITPGGKPWLAAHPRASNIGSDWPT